MATSASAADLTSSVDMMKEAVLKGVHDAPVQVAVAVVLVILAMWARRNSRPWGQFGPTELPIVGAMGWVREYPLKGRVLEGLLDLMRRSSFATVSIKWFGSPRYHLVADPAIVEHVLKTKFDNYPKGEDFNSKLRTLLGRTGIFAVDGPVWKRERQIASHMFSDNSFRNVIMGAFIQHGVQLEQLLERHVASGEPLDVFRAMGAFTLDSIGAAAYGTCIGALAALRDGQPLPAFAQAFDDAQQTIDLRFFTPGWRVIAALGLNEGERRLKRSMKVLTQFCRELITQRRALGQAALEKRTDILSRAMCWKDDERGGRLLYSDQELQNFVLSFLIAGRDTTQQALSWCFTLLAQHPDVEAAVAKEAQACEASGGAEQAGIAPGTLPAGAFAPTYDTVSKQLKYCTATVKETLRLFPSVPKDLKEAAADDTLPDGTRVRAGEGVVYLPFAMGRNPRIWGADCEVFRPQRFVERPQPSPFQFIAFNAGPRTCLGTNMALTEATFVLALIQRRFRFEAVDAPASVVPADSLTLPQANGFRVRVLRR